MFDAAIFRIRITRGQCFATLGGEGFVFLVIWGQLVEPIETAVHQIWRKLVFLSHSAALGRKFKFLRELCAILTHKDLHPKAICGNVGKFYTLLGVGRFWFIFAACRSEQTWVRADPGRWGVRAFRAGRRECSSYPEVDGIFVHFRFPGRGQRDTPLTGGSPLRKE